MKSFRIEIESDFPEWGRYDVYMTAVCFDTAGQMIDYVSCAGGDTSVEATPGTILETPPCDHADLYLYVIAREFPASDVISKSPPFEVEILVSAEDGKGGKRSSSIACLVNQWGGLSVKRTLE